MKAIQLLNLSGALALVLTATAGCEQSKPSAGSSMSVPGAYAALVNAVGACGQQASDCATQAQGDMTALQACRDQLSMCRDNARGSTVGPLADAIRACTNTNQQCVKGADADAHATCHAQLESCLGAARPAHPDHGDDADGGDDTDRANHAQSPVDACIDAMRVCVEADGNARSCAEQMHTCVVASVPAASVGNGNQGGRDASAPHADAGQSGAPHGQRADAGQSGASHGQPADAGQSGASHGQPADAGMPSQACEDQKAACLAMGGAAQDCAKQLRDCNHMH